MNVSNKKQFLKHNTDVFHRIIQATHHDPFSYLGLHQLDKMVVFRTFQAGAKNVSIKLNNTWQTLNNIEQSGLFTWDNIEGLAPTLPITLKISTDQSAYEIIDPYSIGNTINPSDLDLFNQGKLKAAYTIFGAHCMTVDDVKGVRFAVWAPNADRVSVIGSFNQWDGRMHAMRSHASSGVWDMFIPNLTSHDTYKFEIRNQQTGNVVVKTDPYGFQFEKRPSTAAKIHQSTHEWKDANWIENRASWDWLHAPFNCYEVHLGAWRRKENNAFLTYRELADSLVAYVVQMGYTHVELMPTAEHPLNESWGYQTTGYFAATNRFGTPDDLRYLIDCLHQVNIGVILDWVPGHFPKDDWALGRFDGTALYEHEDPRRGEHQDWGTYIFNYGRNEVRNFLLANAHYWMHEFHVDGLRVDAVASMLYLDYSRKEGEWLPNKFGGRENLEVVDFLKELNVMVSEDFKGVLTIAEESTSWPMVSRPVYMGGLGFSMKWNLGWMNDTLAYMSEDPIHRKHHHQKLTFGQLYSYSENFVLPFSHDEVVHEKNSLLQKMPGDAWQKMANLRLLMTYQMTSPGKKLNFMGNEFAQHCEWNENASLDWHLLAENDANTHIAHQGIQQLNKDLNHLYLSTNALYSLDFDREGFHWLDCDNADQSIISFIRRGIDDSFVIIVLNFTPVVRHDYQIGLPEAGIYQECFNSDARCYGGSNQGNGLGIQTINEPWNQQLQSATITLPPLAGIILNLIKS